ncbi:MAG: L,D-transpeptidase [Pseudomonadota bacterium]
MKAWLFLAVFALSVSAEAQSIGESELREAVSQLLAGDLVAAETALAPLLEIQPRYRLAHLLYADIQQARAGKPLAFERSDWPDSAELRAQLEELRKRWSYKPGRRARQAPSALIQVPRTIQTVLLVDTDRGRLYRVENGEDGLRLRDDYYSAIGKRGAGKTKAWDRLTPLGTYFLVDRLENREIHDKYGALAYPSDYPNAWDKRLGKTGDGIWLHGTERDGFARPPLDSDGCVVLTNADLLALQNALYPEQTPIIIARSLDWRAPSHQRTEQLQSSLTQFLEQWRQALQSRDPARFLALYSADFAPPNSSSIDWRELRTQALSQGGAMDVSVSDVFISAYPEQKDLYLLRFKLNLVGEDFARQTYKRLYVKRQPQGGWRIEAAGNG